MVADRIAVMDRGRLAQVGAAGRNLRAAEFALGRRFHRRRDLDRGPRSMPAARSRRALGRLRAAPGEGEARRQGLAGAAAGKAAHRRRERPRRRRQRACRQRVRDRLSRRHVDLQGAARRRLADARSPCRTRAPGRPAFAVGDAVWLSWPAACRRGADAMSAPARPARALWASGSMLLVPYLWLVAVLPRAVRHRAQDQPVADGDRAAALYAGARSRRRLAGPAGFLRRGFRSTITACSAPTRSICSSYLKSLQVAGVSTAILLLIGYPIAYGIARAPRAPAAAAGHAGGAAVLDLVPDPRLCLDQHPAARRPAQRGAAARCASSTRRWPGWPPTPRSISASSIPICRSWCCRSTPRSRRWTRRCWKPPPISAAARWKRVLAGDAAAVAARASRPARCLCFIPIVGEFVIPDLLGGSGRR